MKNITKVFAFALLVCVIGLTSCTNQELENEEVQVDHSKIKRPGSGGQ